MDSVSELGVESYIRHKDFICPSPPSGSGYPPRILKQAGLESSGQRLISSIGETKRIGFFSSSFFVKKEIFAKCSVFFHSDFFGFF